MTMNTITPMEKIYNYKPNKKQAELREKAPLVVFHAIYRLSIRPAKPPPGNKVTFNCRSSGTGITTRL